jgi:hypothetical protein
MRVTQLKVVLAALAMAGLALVLFLQERRLELLRSENAALGRQLEEAAALHAKRARLGEPPPPVAETALSRQQRAELLRLRGEVTRLRKEARQTVPGGPTTTAMQSDAAAGNNLSETNEVLFTAAANVTVRNGESFATGGWLTSPGMRTFLLATPSLGKGDTDAPLITIAMCLLKVAEGDLPQAFLGKLDNPSQTESPVLTGSEAAFLKDMAGSGEGTNVIDRPRIATSDGTPASLFVGETRPNPDGTERQIGTMISVSPQLGQDGQTIRLAVNLEYTPRENTGDDAPEKPN